jgi:hypothetical protein
MRGRGVRGLWAWAMVVLGLSLLGGTATASADPADTTPPVVVSSSANPSSVDVGSGPASVVITAHVTDASGVSTSIPDQPELWLNSDLSNTQESSIVEPTLVSGTIQDGVWQATVSIPQGSAPGAWSCDVSFWDTSRNQTFTTCSAGQVTVAGASTTPVTPITGPTTTTATTTQPSTPTSTTALTPPATNASPGSTSAFSGVISPGKSPTSGTVLVPPSNLFVFGYPRLTQDGYLQIWVRAPGAGRFAAKATYRTTIVRTVLRHGKKIKQHLTKTLTFTQATLSFSGPSAEMATLRSSRALQAALKRAGKVILTVSFVPTGGTSRTRTVVIAG